MSAIDNVKGHFSSLDTIKIDVPEWDLVIYADPFTLKEKNKLFKMSRDNDLAMMAYTLIMKAKNETGDALFTLADKQDLMTKADPDLLSNVATKILRVDEDEDWEKN